MRNRNSITLVLLAYAALLIDILVFKRVPVIRIGHRMLKVGGTHTGPPNFVPFRTILFYLHSGKGLVIVGLNLIGNIVVLIPVGFLAPFVFRGMDWRRAILLAVASGLTIEGMQAIFQVGIFDVDDLILNGLGVMFGYCCFAIGHSAPVTRAHTSEPR
ncbi:MAG TPA: VanZ family protein [Puia sp.]|nr:VanZ family protein [Puia sp.]